MPCMAKFSQVNSLGKSPRRKYNYFYRYINFPTTQRGQIKGSLNAKNQLNQSSRFKRTLTCDRKTQRDS